MKGLCLPCFYTCSKTYVWCIAEEHPSTAKRPSSNPSVLTGVDILIICESLKNASKDWLNLGLALGIMYTDLKNIEDQYSDNNRRLIEMVGKRLEVTDPEYPMTWPYICECLRSPTVQRNDVAEKIDQRWIRTDV